MTLREWLDKKIDSIRKRGYEPLDTWGNNYWEGYSKACRDVRRLLDKADASPVQPKEDTL